MKATHISSLGYLCFLRKAKLARDQFTQGQSSNHSTFDVLILTSEELLMFHLRKVLRVLCSFFSMESLFLCYLHHVSGGVGANTVKS